MQTAGALISPARLPITRSSGPKTESPEALDSRRRMLAGSALAALARALFLTCGALALVVVAGCASGRPRATLPAKHTQSADPVSDLANIGESNTERWAGYTWRGRVESVQASWTVPRILSGSPLGEAGTWIGALTEADPPWWSRAPISKRINYQPPFIQVGTYEGVLSAHGRRYGGAFAFWSDTVHRFLPVVLFTVRSGDDVEAKLAHRRGQWLVSIVDKSSGTQRQLFTRDEAGSASDTAQWFQERLVPRSSRQTHGYASTYPQLSTVRMRALAINSTKPRYEDLRASWMSEDGRFLAPSRLRNDSFALYSTSLCQGRANSHPFAPVENALPVGCRAG
jgi:hypothetical protein